MDVVVLGGGPAGTSTALALARAGRSVVVLEGSRYESLRIGETLPPEIKLPLGELGVWERFLDDGHARSPGITSAWGGPELRDNDFIFNPFGHGWHVDRRRFDAMLARAAEAQGAEVLRAARLLDWDHDPSGKWVLRVNVDCLDLHLGSSILVDATGRSASPVRRLGGNRIVHDRLVGLVGFVPGEFGMSQRDSRTLVEATETGWWYSALLPGGRHVAAFMTDADLIPAGHAHRATFWNDRLGEAHLTRSRLGKELRNVELRVVAANSSRMECVADDGRLAVGDAAATLDPLSSQGVYRALGSGLAAAQAIDDYLRGNREALKGYAGQIEADFAEDLHAWAEYYGRERRWFGSPFWKRRHAQNSGE